MRVFGERGIRIATHRNNFHLKPRDRGQNAHQLFSFAARAQSQDHITVGHHPEVAVQGVQRIQHHRGRTGACQGGGDLASNVPGLTDAEHDHLTPRIHRIFDQADGARKVVAQPLAQSLQLDNFDVENTFGLFQIIHLS